MPITPRFNMRDLARLGERDARRGIGEWDIAKGETTGFSSADIETLRLACHAEAMLLTIRCPKQNSRMMIGRLPPKPRTEKAKSDRDGIGPGDAWVSDYDIMGVFAFARGRTYTRIVTTAPAPDRYAEPRLTADGQALLDMLNPHMEHPFMHGANDDWCDLNGKPFNGADRLVGARFVAFTETAWVRYLPSFGHLNKFYRDMGLDWPY